MTVTNVSTRTTSLSKTNGTGFYNFPSLEVGTYNVRVSQSGFKTTTFQGVVVQVGQSSTVNVVLQIGMMNQTLTVAADVPLLRATESSVGSVVDQNLIENLPLSGRRYTDFVLLTPNVTADGEFGLLSMGGQQGSASSGYANGNGANSFSVDGANATSNYFGEARGLTRVPYIFGEQSVKEFQVSDNPYNAAYGGAGAGFVNTVTKSGADIWHGDAFYYNRNSGVGNANNAVDKANGVPRPLDVLQQFGADLGGPIMKRKAWVYFDYEQQRRKEPISVINPAFTGIDETSFGVPAGTPLPALNSPYPVPGSFGTAPALNDPNFPAYLQQVSNALGAIDRNLGQRDRRADDLSFFPKLDWQATAADHISFVYNYNRFNSPGGAITFNPVAAFGVEALPNNYVRDHHATAHWTHTFSESFLNDAHVSFLRDEQIYSASGLTSPSLGLIGFFSPSSFQLGNVITSADTKESEWQINDHVTYLVGRHTLNFGFDFDRTHVRDFSLGNFFGFYGFANPTNFALGRFAFFSQTGGNPVFLLSYPFYGFFVQDKFQALKNLTLDFGLRQDFQVFPKPTANTLTGDPLIAQLTGQFPNQYSRLSPRFGFAYQPFSKMVVRGGFGMFREILDGINYENSVISNGLQQSSTFLAFNPQLPPNAQAIVFPQFFTNTSSFVGSPNLSIVDPRFRFPYVLESSLEIQLELLPDTTLAVGTMWTHGVHLLASSAYDKNLIPPAGTTTYIVCPAGVTAPSSAVCPGPAFTGPNLDSGLLTDGLISSAVTQINALISPGVNNYDSFYVHVQRRAVRGLSLVSSYTFSKGIQTRVDFFNQFDLKDTHAPSLLDQRHRLSIAAVYAPDASKLSNTFTRRLVSDWTISTVMQFNSGRPYTGMLATACTGPNISTCTGANNGLNDSSFNQTTRNTSGGISPSPTLKLNSFYGPWINEIDLGLTRSFHIRDRHTIQVVAQVFNLFNHPNYFVQNGSGISSIQYDPTGTTCGDGASVNQTCFLVPDPNFQKLESISQLNGPRTFQFAFRYSF